jgi:hypothetical protein
VPKNSSWKFGFPQISIRVIRYVLHQALPADLPCLSMPFCHDSIFLAQRITLAMPTPNRYAVPEKLKPSSSRSCGEKSPERTTPSPP